MIVYESTRGGAGIRSFEDVLLAGLAEDGGLFVPTSWPDLGREGLQRLQGLSYADTAASILAPFVGDCFDVEEIATLASRAYAGFAHPATAPLRQLDHDEWILELFHGPTLAFKDFALQLLGLMFETVLARRDETITIVGATSGDTGSAAIAAIAGRANMRIAVLHPRGRVSEVQRRQMTTVSEANVLNLAVEGTFDDCQDLVKAMFNDPAFRKDLRLAAVNSINWARVAAQAAYYVYASLRLGGLDRPLLFSVPTGNFGDVYAGYVAHRMGLPISRLIVATNRNDILSRFLTTGRYSAGEVHPTVSPSMDIQVASNFERLLFEMMGRDGEAVRAHMAAFKKEGSLEVPTTKLGEVRQLFVGERVEEEETLATMREVSARSRTLVDPHTAVGIAAGRRHFDPCKAALVTLATAHPAKFPDATKAACGSVGALPEALADLMERPERCTTVTNDLSSVKDAILEFAKEGL